MADRQTKALLAVIVILLAAITAKLYLPAASMIGPSLMPPTKADFLALRNVDPSIRTDARRHLEGQIPLLSVHDGNLNVQVDGGNVTVDGTVEIDR